MEYLIKLYALNAIIEATCGEEGAEREGKRERERERGRGEEGREGGREYLTLN